jgi:anti-anti-sigma regulatory factor
MELELSVAADVSRIKLPQTMSIADAAGLKARLQEVIDVHPGRIIIDLDAVVSADTAGLQLLTAFVISASRNGSVIEWDNLSVPLYMSACQLNLEEALQF